MMTDKVLKALLMLLLVSIPLRTPRARARVVTKLMAVGVKTPMLSTLKGTRTKPSLAHCSPISLSLRSCAMAAALPGDSAFLATTSPRVVLDRTTSTSVSWYPWPWPRSVKAGRSKSPGRLSEPGTRNRGSRTVARPASEAEGHQVVSDSVVAIHAFWVAATHETVISPFISILVTRGAREVGLVHGAAQLILDNSAELL